MIFLKVSDEQEILEYPISQEEILSRCGTVDVASLEKLGYRPAYFNNADVPLETKNQKVSLSTELKKLLDGRYIRIYYLEDKNPEEIKIGIERGFVKVRAKRDKLIKDFAWVYERHAREVRMGIPTTYDINDLDEYFQALADITKCDDPFDIKWPVIPPTKFLKYIIKGDL